MKKNLSTEARDQKDLSVAMNRKINEGHPIGWLFILNNGNVMELERIANLFRQNRKTLTFNYLNLKTLVTISAWQRLIV